MRPYISWGSAFCHFEFGGQTEFCRFEFGGQTRFGRFEFGGQTRFGRFEFGGQTDFSHFEFGGQTRFSHFEFGGQTEFRTLPRLLHEMNESMTVNFSYKCSDPNVGFGLHKESDYFKIYIGDTGLFVTLAFWDSDITNNTIYSKILADKLSVDLGYIFENLIAQMIRASGRSLYYYTWPQRDDLKKYYEIDFLLSHRDKLIPIEVKSGGYRTHKSLDAFCEKFPDRLLYPLLVYNKAPYREGTLKYIPFYLFPILLSDL